MLPLVDGAALSRLARLAEGPVAPVRAELAAPGPGLFGRFALGTCRISREQCHIAATGQDGMLVVSVDHGQVEGIGDCGAFIAREGDVLLVDMGEAIIGRCADLQAHFAMLPPWLCDAGMMRQGGWHGTILPKGSGVAPLVRAAIAFALAGAGEDRAGLCTSLGALMAAGRTHSGGYGAAGGGGPPASLRRFIHDNLDDPDLSAARLAREFGMARASLYRHFDQLGGIAAYIRSLRLRRARELIERSGGQGLRLGSLAAEVGFASPTVFARAFRQAYGMTPRECLRRVRADQTGGAPLVDARG